MSIDDKIEVFYEVKGSEPILNDIVNVHGDRIKKAIKMPFLPASDMKPDAKVVGKTYYSLTEEAADQIELTVCMA